MPDKNIVVYEKKTIWNLNENIHPEIKNQHVLCFVKFSIMKDKY